MDEETRAIRTDIEQTRGELGDAVEELSGRIAPRRQAERIVAERRDAARERIRSLSGEDLGELATRVQAAVRARPQAAAAAAGAVALLLLRRRARRR
jgi:Protein of unknown function (DUF3618)